MMFDSAVARLFISLKELDLIDSDNYYSIGVKVMQITLLL